MSFDDEFCDKIAEAKVYRLWWRQRNNILAKSVEKTIGEISKNIFCYKWSQMNSQKVWFVRYTWKIWYETPKYLQQFQSWPKHYEIKVVHLIP